MNLLNDYRTPVKDRGQILLSYIDWMDSYLIMAKHCCLITAYFIETLPFSLKWHFNLLRTGLFWAIGTKHFLEINLLGHFNAKNYANIKFI